MKYINQARKYGAQVVSGSALALVSAASFAQIDISTTAAAVETDLTHVVTTIGAVLLVGAGIAVAYKWGKAALFS